MVCPGGKACLFCCGIQLSEGNIDMKKNLFVTAIVAALGISAGAASAKTVYLGGYGGNDFHGVYDDFTVKASAGGPYNNSAYLYQSRYGLGVNGGPDTQPSMLDSFPLHSWEQLDFHFDQHVRVKEIKFWGMDGNDEVDVFGEAFGGSNTWSGDELVKTFSIRAEGRRSEGDGGYVYELDLGRWGSVSIPKKQWKADALYVKKIDYHVEPVPLPAAGWMLLAGFGGLAAMKRRLKKKA